MLLLLRIAPWRSRSVRERCASFRSGASRARLFVTSASRAQGQPARGSAVPVSCARSAAAGLALARAVERAYASSRAGSALPAHPQRRRRPRPATTAAPTANIGSNCRERRKTRHRPHRREQRRHAPAPAARPLPRRRPRHLHRLGTRNRPAAAGTRHGQNARCGHQQPPAATAKAPAAPSMPAPASAVVQPEHAVALRRLPGVPQPDPIADARGASRRRVQPDRATAPNTRTACTATPTRTSRACVRSSTR